MRLRTPSRLPTKSLTPLCQLAQDGVVLLVALDRRPCVGGFHRLLEQTDLSRDAAIQDLPSYTGSFTISLSTAAPKNDGPSRLL